MEERQSKFQDRGGAGPASEEKIRTEGGGEQWAGALLEPKVEIFTDSEAEDYQEYQRKEEEETENTEPVQLEPLSAASEIGVVMVRMRTQHVRKKSKETAGTSSRCCRKRRHVCEVCGYGTDRSADLAKHRRTHSSRDSRASYPCSECGKLFTQKSSLKTHSQCHASDGRSLSCDLCGCNFELQEQLATHLSDQHGCPPLKCPLCRFLSGTRGGVSRHFQDGHPTERLYECEICGYWTNRPVDLEKHERKHTGEKPFECEVCGKSYKQQRSLKKHAESHASADSRLTCELCSQTFSQRSEFLAHLSEFHQTSVWSCPRCPFVSALKEAVAEHFTESHPDSKLFECQTCGYLSDRLSRLKLHRRTHTEEKPFECSVCGKAFKFKASLQTHSQSHAVQGKPLICDLCSLSLGRREELVAHLAADHQVAPHFCTLCEFACGRRDGVTVHLEEAHPGLRSFECNLCDYTTGKSGNLERHKRKHTGERPFECVACGRGFARLESLKAHGRSSHSSGGVGGDFRRTPPPFDWVPQQLSDSCLQTPIP